MHARKTELGDYAIISLDVSLSGRIAKLASILTHDGVLGERVYTSE